MRGILGSAVGLGVVALATAAGGSAQPSGQQVVLPGPVPYPTDSPPLLGKTALPNAYLGPLLHIASGQRVFVGVDSEGRVARVVDRRRLAAAYATFVGLVRVPKQKVPIEAPLRVEGELRLPGQAPVSFSRTLGDGRPLSFRVAARGSGTPKVHLLARPSPVVRLLRPPGAETWVQAVRRRSLPAPFLLRRLIETRMRLLRAGQYPPFPSDPDMDGPTRSLYGDDAGGASASPGGSAPPGDVGGGTSALLVVAITLGSVVLAGGGLVLWAHL